MSLSIKTPLLESLPFSQLAGTKVWMKMEAAQPSGSFKIRGVGYACEQHHARGAKRFISSSGGNAGLAVAYAGRRLGVPVIVVVPETTTERARNLLGLEGAEVIVHGKSWFEANELARSLLTSDDAFIHPFDDPLLWEGHASMIDEVVAEGVRPDAVVLSVGGGGLLAGVDRGLCRNGLGSIPIYAVETEGMASFNASIKAGQLTEVTVLSGVATSLGARQVCQRAFDISKERRVVPVQVTDQEAVGACLVYLNDHRTLVEPACGAALALLYGNKVALSDFSNVLVIVCGGSTATIESLSSFRG
ncbi:pyridoxal-phosphate dependent enzyme [Pseudomonas sp. ICMP22404]|uniref:pyridoxal-phosphate dependent enzyme n=1 Tax=Pseudomonas TaxID=286 RepID=UPI001118BEF7|nr:MULTISPECIES: pyridoxal-phosphate dependent enzyme [Pseudomonas]MCI0994852.1 pyridoxal-phosphate dependent enzyme [Pseudomonas corrugata]NUT66083.1 pyridoxal-phosphate dependent enzyme [Pseudomonas corrugata]TNF84589.1 pyridoxal-phosphate dependent enzyme [Pseudomonas sp. ICMP22404]